jgi:D-alanyl-D-alanine carboxypeptidase (penicillin-binding protein 5/6)
VKDEQFSIGNKSDLVAGEKITVENVLKALLIGSGNDAALALGQHHPKGYNYFIDLMNQKAQKLSLKNAHYSNVSGVEQENHYMSARDLSILAREAMKNPVIKQIVATKSEVITSIDGKIAHKLENTNPLLGKVAGVDGIKTGWTARAGECLVTHTQRNGKEIVVVVLGSKDRSGDSQQIIEWVYQNVSWKPFPKEIIQPIPVPRQDQSLGLSL